MESLFVRRVIVWVGSMVAGVVTTLLILWFVLPAVSPAPDASAIGPLEYGLQYFFWTAFPIGMMFLTILDGVLGTRIWPD
jgi:hypothetical protein